MGFVDFLVVDQAGSCDLSLTMALEELQVDVMDGMQESH